MYLGDTLSGVPQWKGVSTVTGWQQSDVDARWQEIGQPPPAPLVPASMIGWKIAGTRGPHMLQTTPATKNLADVKTLMKVNSKGVRGVTREENDFWNFFVKAAADPYRKQSGISKVAGGVLQVASVAIPAMSYFQAVTAAGNAGFAAGSQGGDALLAQRVLTPAIVAQDARETDTANAALDAQLKKLQALAPTSSAQAVDLRPKAPTRAPWSNTEISLAAILGGAILLGAMNR